MPWTASRTGRTARISRCGAASGRGWRTTRRKCCRRQARGGSGVGAPGLDVLQRRGQVLEVAARVIATRDLGAHQLAQHAQRSEEHTSELQSLMRISYAVFCLKKKKHKTTPN